jgi:hypothetical protein
VTTDDERLQRVLGRLGDRLTDGGPVGVSLCATCVDILDVTGAGVALMGHDGHHAAWSVSNPTMGDLEDLEQTLGEGPCIEAYASGLPVLEPDLAGHGAERWVALTGPALAVGIGAVFGFPLSVGPARIGALNLYTERPGALTPDQHSDALVLADVVTNVVLTVQDGAAGDSLAGELADLGQHQVRVHQATGMIAAQVDRSVADALALLRARAYAEDRPISDVASDVIERRLRFTR